MLIDIRVLIRTYVREFRNPRYQTGLVQISIKLSMVGLLGMIEIESFQVFGNPDEEVRNSLSPLGAKFHSSIGGFSR